MSFIQVVLLTIIFQHSDTKSLNILGIFPYHGKSHFIVHETVLRELAQRGHNVTVISYFKQNNQIKNYHDIELNGTSGAPLGGSVIDDPSYFKIIGVGLFLITSGANNCKVLLSNEKVQELWRSERKFDVLITEQFNSDCSLGLAYKLRAPVVGITSTSVMPYHYSRFGVPQNPSYTPFQLLNGGTKSNLIQRFERTIFTIFFNAVKLISQYIDQRTLNQYFDNIPPLEELGRDIKFLLVYEYFVFFTTYAYPTNVIPIGGLHVKEAKPLPLELQKYIDESKHGVIYISFGTMLKGSLLPPKKLEAIVRATEKLPQRVIWKWDSGNLPGKFEKIYLTKWLPQRDLLAHPKVLAMFSHGGLLSLMEAMHCGVPAIAMPVLADHPRNAAAAEEIGLGVQIQVSELTEEALLQTFRKILEPGFRENVKRLSKMWHDRPVSAMDTAVFWVEYAARYHNVTFRTAAADVPLYQYLCLDILFVFIITLTAFIVAVKYVLKLCTTKNAVKSRNKSKVL